MREGLIMLRWMKDNWKVVRKVISHHTGKILFLIGIELVSMALAVAIPMLNMELINLFAYEKWRISVYLWGN